MVEINGKQYNVLKCSDYDYQESLEILSNIDSLDNNIASTAIIEILNKALDNAVPTEEMENLDTNLITEIILTYFDEAMSTTDDFPS